MISTSGTIVAMNGTSTTTANGESSQPPTPQPMPAPMSAPRIGSPDERVTNAPSAPNTIVATMIARKFGSGRCRMRVLVATSQPAKPPTPTATARRAIRFGIDFITNAPPPKSSAPISGHSRCPISPVPTASLSSSGSESAKIGSTSASNGPTDRLPRRMPKKPAPSVAPTRLEKALQRRLAWLTKRFRPTQSPMHTSTEMSVVANMLSTRSKSALPISPPKPPAARMSSRTLPITATEIRPALSGCSLDIRANP